MIQIDFWGNGNNWSIEVVDYICDDDDDDGEDNPGCWGNSGIIGALAPPRIWDYLPNLLSLHQILQGSGIIGATKDFGFGIICPTCLLFRVRKLFLYVGFAKDFGLFVQIETESENYFWIWDYFPNQGFWIICPTCFLFSTRVRKLFMFSFLLLINPVCFWRWPE